MVDSWVNSLGKSCNYCVKLMSDFGKVIQGYNPELLIVIERIVRIK